MVNATMKRRSVLSLAAALAAAFVPAAVKADDEWSRGGKVYTGTTRIHGIPPPPPQPPAQQAPPVPDLAELQRRVDDISRRFSQIHNAAKSSQSPEEFQARVQVITDVLV